MLLIQVLLWHCVMRRTQFLCSVDTQISCHGLPDTDNEARQIQPCPSFPSSLNRQVVDRVLLTSLKLIGQFLINVFFNGYVPPCATLSSPGCFYLMLKVIMSRCVAESDVIKLGLYLNVQHRPARFGAYELRYLGCKCHPETP